MRMNCFVIAEVGVNHNGSMQLARELVAIAANAGADAVKFQSFKAEELARSGARKAEYQMRQTGTDDQLSMLKKLELSRSDHIELKAYCSELGIEFMSSVFSESTVDLLASLHVKRIKIPSGEINNKRLLRKAAETQLPLILSTGMSNFDEVERAVEWICEIWKSSGLCDDACAKQLSLLHCTSNYPTSDADVNLKAMDTLSALGFPVGFSDHTPDILIAPCAVAMGASIIEKHFTVSRNLDGPDHLASLEPEDLAAMIAAIRRVEVACGDGAKTLRQSERSVRDVARKSVTLVRDVECGQVLQADDLDVLRPGTGIEPYEIDNVIGTRAAAAMTASRTLCWTDIIKDDASSKKASTRRTKT